MSYEIDMAEMSFDELVSITQHVGKSSAWDKNQLLMKTAKYCYPRPPMLHWRDEDVVAVTDALRYAWDHME